MKYVDYNPHASFSRGKAFEDGYLIDVSNIAQEIGFKIPVAITIDLYSSYIKTGNNTYEKERIWETLFVFALYGMYSNENCIYFNVIYKMSHEDINVTLKAVIGPGDSCEPVITIML